MSDIPSQEIRFLLGGKAQSVPLTDRNGPTQTVLNYLRETRGRTGTKEGCAEGDCGACTVVVGDLCEGQVRLRPVNACIQFLPTLDGKALITVEDLRQSDGSLHPVQQAMVDCHGSQCGFCTPGFVMSLWSLYQQSDQLPTESTIRDALSGNLCRCTGYKPIIEAGHRMFDLPKVAFDLDALKQSLLGIQRQTSLTLHHQGQHFFAPRSLAELLPLRVAHPQATILAGCTDIGLWVNKQFRPLGDIIFIGEVTELKAIRQTASTLSIGAAVSLTDAYAALKGPYPEMNELWTRFASRPIRNAGTLGGNVANGSPIGDSMPALIALGASVTLASVSGTRTLPLEALYLGYMKNAIAANEVLTAIDIPLPTPSQHFRAYKVSKRFDSDISAVCAAFALQLEGDKIVSSRVAFGGMAATPKRATSTEAALNGKPWNETTARAAKAALAEDYAPLSDLRASREYRLTAAQNLLTRFFLETRPDIPLPAEAVRVF
ncbi:MAG: xanthine dehydrogenase small subunit, partial [Betaproteobacteria bacterium]|nr:xanthine dehydrogenase small subunit [Betaproteobacteria bacterium]